MQAACVYHNDLFW